MMIIKCYFIIMLILGSITSIKAADSKPRKNHRCSQHITSKNRDGFHKSIRFISQVVMDVLTLNSNLFSITSAKIITGFIPSYIIARQWDETIQSNFYDRNNHKNINQFPTTVHQLAKYGVGIPMVGLSSLAVLARTQDLRTTARIFALALPFVHSGKDIIKKLNCKACLRPWHEAFAKDQRSLGGFPSGHMANITFMATLFGMRHGARWGIPLGLLATFVCADFLNCNRHYASQLVAGAGLGVMFAYACNALIDKKLHEHHKVLLTADYGPSGLSLQYFF